MPRPHRSSDPANTVSSVKRLMGRTRAQVADADKLPYTVVDDSPAWPCVETAVGARHPWR